MKLLAQSFLGNSFKVENSDLLDISPCKPTPRIFLSLILKIALFRNHIPRVIRKSAKKKMVGPNTMFNVTMMKDVQTLRDGAIVNDPRGSMGSYNRVVPVASDDAIPRMVAARLPEPARFGFSHLRPKALWEGFGKSLRGKVSGRNLDHSSLVLPFGLLARAAFLFHHNGQ